LGHKNVTIATIKKLRTKSSSDIPSLRRLSTQLLADGKEFKPMTLRKPCFALSDFAVVIVEPPIGMPKTS